VSDAPVDLHVEAHGSGPVVVLAHGFGGSARNWRPQVRALQDRYRVVVYDARGHARSEAPEDPAAYEPEACVADLARVVDEHAGGEPAVVGGLSMGAGVALRFALAHRERVRGLVLAAPPPGRSRGTAGSGDALSSWASDFADAIEREGLDAAGARYAWGERSGLDEKGAEWVRQGFLEHPPHALAALLRRLVATWPSPDELAPELRRLDAPVLLLVGERDAPSLRTARALADHLPRARLVVAPDAGHVVNLAARALTNEALAEFLGGLA
jgi:pimeloyl-ACP methyl ester carboxylesterase